MVTIEKRGSITDSLKDPKYTGKSQARRALAYIALKEYGIWEEFVNKCWPGAGSRYGLQIIGELEHDYINIDTGLLHKYIDELPSQLRELVKSSEIVFTLDSKDSLKEEDQIVQFPASSIPKRWNIQNPFLQAINSQGVEYRIVGSGIGAFSEAVFYFPGLGGSLDDCPEINEFATTKRPIIRVSGYGLRPFTPLLTPLATFGDVCALLYNSRQALLGIANALQLSSYRITGHSWGGFIALLSALADPRCKKCMLLCSSPDICDAITRMGKLVPFFGDFIPFIVRLITPGISWDAHSAKFGKAIHQAAWDVISPYKPSNNPDLELLILNNWEDKVMVKEGVSHFLEYCQTVPIAQTTVIFAKEFHKGRLHFVEYCQTGFVSQTTKKFTKDPRRRDPSHHDMPFSLFNQEMFKFLITD